MHWRQNTQGCHLQQPEINHSFWWTCSNGDVGMGMPKKSPHIESQREGPQWTTMWHQPSRATAAYSWTKTRLFFRSLSGMLLGWHGIFFFIIISPFHVTECWDQQHKASSKVIRQIHRGGVCEQLQNNCLGTTCSSEASKELVFRSWCGVSTNDQLKLAWFLCPFLSICYRI